MPDAELQSKLLLIREEKPRNLYMNMAFDEGLSVAEEDAIFAGASGFLRFYSWDSPCISFGYAQSFQDVFAENPGMPLVRRPSGGGVVVHGEDLTYSVILFPDSKLFSMTRTELYLFFHSAIKMAFAKLGTFCEIRNMAETNSGYYRCFDHPVLGDLLLHDGRKIAGAAQKHSRAVILTQGSVSLYLLAVDRDKFIANFISALAETGALIFKDYASSAKLETITYDFAKNKYSTEMWNKKRRV
jgi:lipoate-protein ligase A